MEDKVKANLLDYDLEYHVDNMVQLRTKDTGLSTPGSWQELGDRTILLIVGEVSIGDIRRIHHTGEPLEVDLKDGKTITIHEDDADMLWREFKDAQFDECEYMDELESKFEDIKERIEDGFRERMDDNRIPVGDIKTWAAKWKQELLNLEDRINQDDGMSERPIKHKGGYVVHKTWVPEGCTLLVSLEDTVDEVR
jgi:hypothetical protein